MTKLNQFLKHVSLEKIAENHIHRFVRCIKLYKSMLGTSKHIVKLQPFVVWIVIFTLIMWTCTHYSLTIFKEVSKVQHSSYTLEYASNNLTFDNDGYLIKTSRCRIPEMFLDGPNVDKYMDYSSKINCLADWDYSLSLVTSNLTALILNLTTLAILNINVEDPLFKCYYSPIKRSTNNQDRDNFDDSKVKLGDKIYFTNSITVLDEMVEVICTLNTNTIYQDYHIFIRPTPGVKSRTNGDLSVLVLGIDAVSRLNFHRQMPKTKALLAQLGNIEMLGYNKVEDNTFPNLIPVLSGLSMEELRSECWPQDESFFDNCHFVWDDFRHFKFDTIFMEDSPMIGMFHYGKSGFLTKPTNHYLRPIMLQAEENIGRQHRGNVFSCIGPQLGMTTLFNYAYKTALSMTNSVYMGFFWSSSLTHDYIEYPRFGDNDLRDFFDGFNRSGELNKTVVILMSDHGLRWGAFRDTYQGGLEDRLPMLRFIVPEWFQKTHSKAMQNLKANIVRLTTPYDLHETLLDLADVKQLNDNLIERRTKFHKFNSRGTSLFLNVPENKSCETAGIPQHYCACHNHRQTLAIDDDNVLEVANFLMHYINFKLSSYSLCANLSLREIQKAVVEMQHNSDNSVKDYEIQVITVPGFAKFEATVRKDGNTFKMVGSVSRLNLYGTQSYCVNDSKIKLLCYCIR